MDEEPRQYRKPSKRAAGQNYHHQNPFVLRTLIDPDQINRSAKAMGQKKRSVTNMGRDASGHASRSNLAGDKQAKPKSHSVHDEHRATKSTYRPEDGEKIEMKKSTSNVEPNNQTKSTPPPSPATENTNIPPPWKSTINVSD